MWHFPFIGEAATLQAYPSHGDTMSNQTLAYALRGALAGLSGRDLDFANSLLASADRGWSAKQEYWANRLVDKANRPAPESVKVDVSGILALLDGAAARLKRPKVRLVTDAGQKVVLSVAGPASRYSGSIMITDGGPFGSNVYFGRIDRDGSLVSAGAMTDEVKNLLFKFAADPAGVGALIGKRIGSCCFCARQLDTKESLAVGYGPVCADKYSLPWG